MSTTHHEPVHASHSTRVAASGVFRPHRRGFGFVDLYTPIVVGDTTLDSAFVPPRQARRAIADDRVDITVDVSDGRATITELRVTERRRRLLAGEIVQWGDGLGFRPDPTLGVSDWPLEHVGNLSVGDVVAVTIRREHRRWKVAKLQAGPYSPTSADAARVYAVVRALGGVHLGTGVARTNDVLRTLQADAIAVAKAGELTHPTDTGAVPPKQRRDLTGMVTFTIDGENTRDLDDAISAHRTRNGIQVTVHISDVASVVAPGSPVDMTAAARGTSLYLAGGNFPMLDRSLSEQALSLSEGVIRNAVSVSYLVPTTGAHAGVPQNVKVFRSTVRSNARLTYSDVEQLLIGGELTGRSAAVTDAVTAAAEAGDTLKRTRNGRTTLEQFFTLPTLTVTLDPSGTPVSIPVRETPRSERLIEAIMVATNETIASWIAATGAPSLYRTHPGIDMTDPNELTAAAGRPLPEQPTAADILSIWEKLDADEQTCFSTVVAHTMQRASYRVTPDPHYGLASQPYTHFTSPIRRYADLVVHRVVESILDGTSTPYTADALAALAEHLDVRSAAAGWAEAAERSMLWTLALLEHGAPVDVDATVTRLNVKGATVRVPRLGVTGWMPASTLGKGWKPDSSGLAGRSSRGRLRVGATVPLRLTGSEGPTGRLEFAHCP